MTLLRRPAEERRPAGRPANSFNENLALFNEGKCGMWVDATVAAGLPHRPEAVQGRRQGGLRAGPDSGSSQGRELAVGVDAGIPAGIQEGDAAKKFITWATSKDYIELVAQGQRLGHGAPRHAQVDLQQPRVPEGGEVRRAREEAIEAANPNNRLPKSCPIRRAVHRPSRSSRPSASRSGSR